MTIYIKELLGRLSDRYGSLSNTQLAAKLFEIGVVDHTLCKVLAVREYVAEEVKSGKKKTDAMWYAAEKFSCTYEYVRKCVYYYTDVNL